MDKPKVTLPDTVKLNALPQPTPSELPSAWSDMNAIERAFFVYRWRVEHGHLVRSGDTNSDLLNAGFTITHYGNHD